jgi:hypothetical protein
VNAAAVGAAGTGAVGLGVVGIVANPAAGKDIRRLVSAASPVSDMAKIGIMRRAAIGAIEGGAHRLVLADDRHALARRALREVDADLASRVEVDVLDLALLSNSLDSQRAAAAMAERGVGAVIVLGGDGTHRDVAKGWRHAPMVALSTGTNNVFPRSLEATTAGHAAGLVASGVVALDEVADDAAVIDVEVTSANGEVISRDLGLVDVALTSGQFTGSRAIWDIASLRDLVTVIAEPDAVGLSAIAAAIEPTGRRERTGVHVQLARCGSTPVAVRCAIAPGRYADVPVAAHRRLKPDDEVALSGPGVLSFDGERDVVLAADHNATVRISADGPRVIDVARAMALRPKASERTANTGENGVRDGR